MGLLGLIVMGYLSGFFAQNTKLTIPIPQIEMPASEIHAEYEFSEYLNFPVENSCKIYKITEISHQEVLDQISRTVGTDIPMNQIALEEEDKKFIFVEDKNLTVSLDSKTGFWSAMESDMGKSGAVEIPQNLPTEDESIEIARLYITENDLFQGDLGEPIIAQSTTGSALTNNEALLSYDITFTPLIGGFDVYGLYKITITIGENGRVENIFKQTNPVEEIGEIKLKSKEQIIDEVLAQPDKLSSSAVDMKKAVVTDCKLAYYMDGSEYVFPVYILIGEEKSQSKRSSMPNDLNADEREFDIIIDAVYRE